MLLFEHFLHVTLGGGGEEKKLLNGQHAQMWITFTVYF